MLTVACSAAQSQDHQALVVSDIHFNPLADASLVDQLTASDASQWEAIFSGDSHMPRQAYTEDTNWILFAAALHGMQSVQPKPEVIILTGDILPHKFQDRFAAATKNSDAAAFRSFAKKTVEFISLELQKASRGVPVIYTPGNNDEDCGDYKLQPNGPFLQDSLASVQSLARLDAKAMSYWVALGSYAAKNPLAKHHRIIAVNSSFWSQKYKNSCADESAPQSDPGAEELKWLENQLKDAKAHGDKVWLAFHIPPGIDGHSSSRAGQVVTLWNSAYSNAFYRLLDDYRKTIELNLAGHMHLDDIRLIKTPHTEALVIITPGVSPNIGQNPAYRVIETDSKARVKDMTTYYTAGLDNINWQVEYSTDKSWGFKRIDAASYAKLYAEIDESPALSEKWKNYYAVSHPTSLSDKKQYLRSLYCATGNAIPDSYQACLNSKN